MDYFISDTHLSHRNILTFERINFNSIEEHDELIKELIRSKVSKKDTLYHLGDVGEMTEENIAFWSSLPCKTILIRGNHDTQKSKLERAFDVVFDAPIFYQKRVLLSHEPLPVTNETINIHGHLHAAVLAKENYINLSLHVIGYKMLTSKDIEKLVMTRPKISQKFMFEWYAKDYLFQGPKDDVVFTRAGKIDLLASRKVQLQKPGMRRKIVAATEHFIEAYPSYRLADVESEIESYILHRYENNANFTPMDVEGYINDPRRIEEDSHG